MTINPYESSSSETEEFVQEDAPATQVRPKGIAILACLHLFGGIVLLFAQFELLNRLGRPESGLAELGISMMAVIFGALFVSALCILSGFGMRYGKQWGWWCGAFYYVYSVFRNGAALLTVVVMADQLQGGSRTLDYYIVRHGARIAVQTLIYIYFFKSNVLAFFGMQSVRKVRATATLIGICVAISIAATVLNYIAFAAR